MKILFYLLLPVLLSGCLGREVIAEEREQLKALVESNTSLSHHFLQVGENTLHYASHGDPQKPALIIVHGTPGDWQQYARYLYNETLLAHYYMVVVDRPGWGQSTLAPQKKIASFEEQAVVLAALAKELRDNNQGQPVILMGHSLGASLIPRVAMDFPELIEGLLLFAGTIDPQLANPRWFNYIANAPLINYLIGDSLHRSNKEIFALKDNIHLMTERWGDIKAQVIAVQGLEDGLVYPKNSDYIEAQFDSNRTQVIRLSNEGHLFPMNRRDDVVNWALTLLERINKERAQ